jgi:mono/diheme cytochrome c family protein
MKRILFTALAILALGVLLVAGIEFDRARDTEQSRPTPVGRAQQLKDGAYLARVGNCMGCHTVRGGKEYAGGRPIATPFGSIYSSNLTPDPQTGIGAWTADDFWRALHNGRSKDGKFLYPAFPYPNYTKVTRTDSDALFAYLQSLAPVRQPNRGNELSFPYNQRALLAFWRVWNFRQGEFAQQPAQDAQWNRGAYLVQGLGHCSACHAERGALGGSIGEQGLGGGMIPMQDWYASSLAADAGDWDAAEVTALLQTGVSRRGAVFGPMAGVVADSLQHVSGGDIASMAAYLKSLPASAAAGGRAPVQVAGDGAAILQLGARVYQRHCVECHGAAGTGSPFAYPALAGKRGMAAEHPVNAIRMVLNGGYPPSTHGNPRPYGMPPFGPSLSDAEVAAVVSYIRTSWGNDGALVSAVEVSRLRGAPAE